MSDINSAMSAAMSGDSAAAAVVEAHFQQLYPSDGQGFAPPAGTPAFAPTATPSDLGEGVPPTPGDYIVGDILSSQAPGTTAALQSWAHSARLSVEAVSTLASRMVALSEEPDLGDDILVGKGEDIMRQIASTPDGARLAANARAAWADLERRQPQLADLLLELGAPADREFVLALGRGYRR